MQFNVVHQSIDTLSTEAIAIPVFSDARLDGAAADADKALGGALSEIFASKEISGKEGEVSLIHSASLPAKRVLAVGLGDRAKFKPSALSRYAGTAVRYLGRRNVHRIAFALPLEAHAHTAAAASFIAEGAMAGTIDTTIHRTSQDRPKIDITDVSIASKAGSHTFDADAIEAGLQRGEIVGEAVAFARSLALEPANFMTPRILADRAKERGEKHGLAVDILDEKRMTELGMGALLGVARGSDEPPRLIVLEYKGDPSSSEKLALVGKGITFDSGGISIKPSDKMEDMKYDMAGAAGVIGAIGAIARLGLKANVVAIAPATENLPGGRAQKPGDVVKAMDGQTIEVINTDAEGRLILADALAYARKLGATKIIDTATLTGAMVVALGHEATGTMSNDDAFAAEFLRVANTTSERYWHLPLYDEFSATVKSEFADLRNSTGREAGSLTAGAFLKAFVGDTPWIHLDIAGTGYLDKESSYQAKGATGYPVRALVAYVEAASKGGVHANGAAKSGASLS
jgi:leucyl aminopeptidase